MNHASSSQHGWSLLILLAITASVAVLAAAASVDAPVFYAQLVKPSWAPPAWVFGPAWTVLYLLMTCAAWLVVRTRGWRHCRLELGVYGLQLTLNALWSWLFFAWRMGNAALLDVVLLWLAIIATLVLFRRVQPWAGWLLIPYLSWVSFATALTYMVCKLNPQLL